MAITAEFIGVYIAGIIITTATITVIGATITAITAIGETYRVAAVSNSSPQGKGRSTRRGLFPFPDPGPAAPSFFYCTESEASLRFRRRLPFNEITRENQ